MSTVTAEQLKDALLAGKLTATFVMSDAHMTITFRGWTRGCGNRIVPLAQAERVYVRSGRDRVAVIHMTGPQAGQLIADRYADPSRFTAAQYILDAALHDGDSSQVLAGQRCLRCDQALTDPVSIQRNMGPDCYGSATGSKAKSRLDGFEWPTPTAEPTAEETFQTIPDLILGADSTLICDFGGYDPRRLAAMKDAVMYKRRSFDSASKQWRLSPNANDARKLLAVIDDGTLIAAAPALDALRRIAGVAQAA